MVSHAIAKGEPVAAYNHTELDITDEAAIDKAFHSSCPDVVINCAAWTDVDGCEFDHERAIAANARGPELLALACRDADALLITISTDYVFDGTKDGFYTQLDQPNPISVYGESKLAGEVRAKAAWDRTVIVRSGYIFGPGGTNFLSTLISRARQGERLTAISDMAGTPTFSIDLAARIYDFACLNHPEIYHVVNDGDGVTFAGFALKALEMAGLNAELVSPISLESLARPAKRPRNSRLRCLVSDELGLKPLPLWQEALARFIRTE